MPLPLKSTPYLLAAEADVALVETLKKLDERVSLLRSTGVLSPDTLKSYYGESRYEQIAESNAIEGSTLSAGETRLAVEKGITLTGHDPAYVKDAFTLDAALTRLEDLARLHQPTVLDEVLELHRLIFGERLGGGLVRDQEVTISQSPHKPPRTKKDVLAHLTALNSWSLDNADVNPVFRAIVLHAWFTHIHPFVDGNGRTARAITTLELVRGGYPPLIIRKMKDRKRYIDALAHSDVAGDLSPLAALLIDRANDALRDLERSAQRRQGYDPIVQRVREAQRQRLNVFLTSLDLLQSMIELEASDRVAGAGGTVSIQRYPESVDLDDYIALCERDPDGNRWAFQVEVTIPAMPTLRLLCWVGYRSGRVESSTTARGPSLYWSKPNPARFPPWLPAGQQCPYAQEIATIPGRGDTVAVVRNDGQVREERLSEVARKVAEAIVELAVPA